MPASQLIKRLQAKIDKYGDKEVSQLMGFCNPYGMLIGEKLVPITRVKYKKKFDKIFVDFV